ncbi:MAG: hypothetical protein ABGX04_15520 [Myxococcales bacterium]|nr:hypothetical protein [Myxococcales bacterium]HIL80724.1 hypothetical protein [Myxococcales bacterium]
MSYALETRAIGEAYGRIRSAQRSHHAHRLRYRYAEEFVSAEARFQRLSIVLLAIVLAGGLRL